MNKFIREQLISLKNVSIKYEGKIISIDDITDDMLEFEIVPYTDGPLKLNKDYIFTFEGYMTRFLSNSSFHVQWNKGVPIPLRIMKGKVIKYLADMAYISCVGISNYETKICSKCLRPGTFNVICDNCLSLLNTDLETITWEGWVPLNAIREAKKLEEV